MQPTAPPLDGSAYKENQMKKLQGVLQRYEVSIADANELCALEGYEIVFLCDDSGSMSLSSVPVSERKLGVQSTTRWEELKDTVSAVAEVACCFDEDGIDVYFLNRPPVRNIVSTQDRSLIKAFEAPPAGRTPLAEAVQRVLHEKRGERPLLLLIATDGEPDGGPEKFRRVVESAIRDKRGLMCKFQILAVTADDEQLQWINDLDDKYYEVDATDDFYSERAEILATGRLRTFTKGDWIMKALLGPILRKFDEWDEAPVHKTLPPPGASSAAPHTTFNHLSRPRSNDKGECCTIM